MYTIQFNKAQLELHISGLDSSVRIIAQQISNSQSSGLALKQSLARMTRINEEFERLQGILDEYERMENMLNKAKDEQKENEAKEKEKV